MLTLSKHTVNKLTASELKDKMPFKVVSDGEVVGYFIASYDVNMPLEGTEKGNYPLDTCSHCGWCGVCDTHHLDEDRSNNKRENIAILCPNCHRDIHRQGLRKGMTKGAEAKRNVRGETPSVNNVKKSAPSELMFSKGKQAKGRMR